MSFTCQNPVKKNTQRLTNSISCRKQGKWIYINTREQARVFLRTHSNNDFPRPLASNEQPHFLSAILCPELRLITGTLSINTCTEPLDDVLCQWNLVDKSHADLVTDRRRREREMGRVRAKNTNSPRAYMLIGGGRGGAATRARRIIDSGMPSRPGLRRIEQDWRRVEMGM
ncbi:hypothetical protein NPIL_8551 [Nephila pilipes]|uniref:Uncharacterized protein n=1 Tax=Nephila pilipes TaxID=299642 RepID=A0A8X6Q489_NEPPI|nr:hypothetical protein NPIL_8551 [Nephila pilipes]